jgi:outer membrane protein
MAFKLKFALFFAIILLFSMSENKLNAQEPWSLEQCISYALENNIQIKQQELNLKVSENRLTQSKMSHLPNLNASANHNYNFGRAIDYGSNTVSKDLASTSFSISSSVTLFNGFQITNSRKQDALNLQASISDVEKLKNNVSLNIASAYLQILYYEELVETAKKQIELSTLQKERTSVLVKAGSLPEGNLLEIEAQLASDELQLVNTQNQLDMAYLVLVQMLDIKTSENFRILKPNLEGFEGSSPADSPIALFAQSQTFMPQIKSADIRVASAVKGLDIAKGGQYPRISLGANINSGSRWYLKESPPIFVNDPFNEQIKNNASVSVGASLTIPIFNGYQVKTSISNAIINVDMAKLNLENEKNILYKDIQQAYTDALAALKKFNATEKSLNALEEAFRYSEQKFSVGLVTSFDYTTSKTRLAKAQADLISAKYEYIFKTKILDFYRGVPIKL